METAIGVQVSFTVSESGVATDAMSLLGQIIVTEVRTGTDVWSLQASFAVSDASAGADVVALAISFTISDAFSGADAWSVATVVSALDSGVGAEEIILTWVFFDAGFATDIFYRPEKQGAITIDSMSLPHVQRIRVSEKTRIAESPCPNLALPYRVFVGLRGQEIQISGWTDSLSELEAIEALADGESHTLYLPTGVGLCVQVKISQPKRDVDDYGRYWYSLQIVEILED